MSKRDKKIPRLSGAKSKQAIVDDRSTDGKKMVWIFDSIDRDGDFRFDLNRDDMDSGLMLRKIVDYSNRTWQEIKRETHDKNNRSCNHFLPYQGLSASAKERVRTLRMTEDEIERIFSLRLLNLIRVIGIRDGERFIVKWYDPTHGFYPTTK